MAKDYIPATISEFYIWQNDFYNRVQEKLASFKIDAAKFKTVTAAQSKYTLAFDRASNPEAASSADIKERQKREKEYKSVIRQFVNENIRFNSAISDYDRVYLGLNVPDTAGTPVPVPASYPDFTIDSSVIRQLTIHFQDHNSKSKARPDGVGGAVIRWAILDEAPGDVDVLFNSDLDTASPYTMVFTEEQRGQRVYFCLAWQNTRGEKGPWSEIGMGIIP